MWCVIKIKAHLWTASILLMFLYFVFRPYHTLIPHVTYSTTPSRINIFWYKHIVYIECVCVCFCMCSDAIWSNMLLIPHSICEWENLLIFIVDWILIYYQNQTNRKNKRKSHLPSTSSLTPNNKLAHKFVKLPSTKYSIVTQFLIARDLMRCV